MTAREPQPAPQASGPALLETVGIGRSFGSVEALAGVSTTIRAGEVTCVLGDNGAGKSTFIKILAGAHQHTSGQLLLEGKPHHFINPRAAQDWGVSTVFQDLAMVFLMSVWRNFFLGRELTKGRGIFRRLDIPRMRALTREGLRAMGIALEDVDRPVGQLSGGQRQSVAIARALHWGAKVLILDEPTAALGVRQSGEVLKAIAGARDKGIGVVFITHNPQHAVLIGDRFLILRGGRSVGEFDSETVDIDTLTGLMAGADELEEIAGGLKRTGRAGA